MFDLKPLPDNLKYAYLDEKKIYPVIISANLSEKEEEKLLKTLKKHRVAIGYTLDDLKGISPTLCQHKIKLEEDAKPVIDHQRRLNRIATRCFFRVFNIFSSSFSERLALIITGYIFLHQDMHI